MRTEDKILGITWELEALLRHNDLYHAELPLTARDGATLIAEAGA